jgi:hypothetical protein
MLLQAAVMKNKMGLTIVFQNDPSTFGGEWLIAMAQTIEPAIGSQAPTERNINIEGSRTNIHKTNIWLLSIRVSN